MRVAGRYLAHLSTAVLLGACAAIVGITTPAVAAPRVDLAITASSSRIPAGSTVKGLSMEVTNLGTGTAHGFTVSLDFGCTRQGCFDPTLDLERVGIRFRTDNDPFCGIHRIGGNAEIKCYQALLPGQRVNLNQLGLAPLTQVPGPAGTFKAIVVGHDEDGGANTANVAVEIVAAKPDLVTTVRDLSAGIAAGTGLAQRITPGETAQLDWLLENFSPFVVTGVELTAQLPEHVSFVTRLAGCTYSPDGRQVTCNVAQLPEPLGQGAVLAPDQEHPWLIKVAADAPGPIQPAGTFSARATASKPESDQAGSPPADGSSPFNWLTTKPALGFVAANSAAGPGETLTTSASGQTAGTDGDADPGDNTDGFTVFIGQGPNPPQGGRPDDSLPITGASTGLIASVGGALLLAGLVLLLMVRRRARRS